MIPNSWDNVTLEQFYPFSRTIDEKADTELEQLDLKIKRACYLTDMEFEDVEKMSMSELNRVDDLIKTPLPIVLTKKIQLNKQWYRVELDPTKLDAWRYKAIMNECRNEKGDNLHRVLYLFCIPIKNRFSSKEIEIAPNEVKGLMDSFKKLSISLVNPLIVFFCNLLNDLMRVTEEYSLKEIQKTTTKMIQMTDSLKSTDG